MTTPNMPPELEWEPAKRIQFPTRIREAAVIMDGFGPMFRTYMTAGMANAAANMKAVLSQLTVVASVLKYRAAEPATGEKVSHC
jgi:hypothetical protein